jgi:hypothetical protein
MKQERPKTQPTALLKPSRKCARCGTVFGVRYLPDRRLCMSCLLDSLNNPPGTPQAIAINRLSHARPSCIGSSATVPRLSFSFRLNLGASLLFAVGDEFPRDHNH